MHKTTTEDMIKTIVFCVSNRNVKNCSDISQETGLDRIAVTRYAKLLSEIGVLVPHYRKNRIYYTLNPDIQKYIENEEGDWIADFGE